MKYDRIIRLTVLVLGILAVSCRDDKSSMPVECLGPTFEEVYPEIEGCWKWMRTDYWNQHEFGDTYAGSDTAEYLFEIVVEGNTVKTYKEGVLELEFTAGDLKYVPTSNLYPYHDQGYLDAVVYDIDCGDETSGFVYKPDSLVSRWPEISTSSLVEYYQYYACCVE